MGVNVVVAVKLAVAVMVGVVPTCDGDVAIAVGSGVDVGDGAQYPEASVTAPRALATPPVWTLVAIEG